MTATEFLKEMKWDKESEYNALPNWYGIEGIKFKWHGEWSDPGIIYKGRECSCYIVEDTMWERYKEENGEYADESLFEQYMRNNADEVKELCKLALFPEEEER